MTCLTSRPVELGQQIWIYLVLPDDIESYSLVCWQIHRLGTKVIIGHRQLRKELTSVGNSISSYLELFQLLELVTANPIHALGPPHYHCSDLESDTCNLHSNAHLLIHARHKLEVVPNGFPLHFALKFV